MLNEQQVVEIYMTKLALQAHSRSDVPGMDMKKVIKGQSARVSIMYGVSSRTIRDIWNHQSWAYVTRHLWDRTPQLITENTISMHPIKVLNHLLFIMTFLGETG